MKEGTPVTKQKLERDFQGALIRQIKADLPNAIVLKTDPNYIQGFPDLLILNETHWAALEVKRGADASKRPNQKHYVDRLDAMSYAAFIYPENKEEVLDELYSALRA